MKALLPLLFVAMPAFAEDCAPRDLIVSRLAEKYGETLVGTMLSQKRGQLVELYGNPETGTATIIATGPDGQACLVASGVGFITEPTGDPA
jgi:hypothetical protein